MENQEVGSNEKNQEVDYKKQLEELKSQNERLLNESKKYKTRFSDVETLKSKLEALEKEKMDRDGDLEAKVNHYKEKFESVHEENRDLKTAILTEKIKDSYRSVAPDCERVDFVINNPSYANDFKMAIDKENLSVDTEVLKGIYERDKKENNFLYGRKSVKANAGGGSTPNTKGIKSTSKTKDMTPDQYREHIKKQLNG